MAYENFYEYEIVEHPNRMVEVNLYMKDESDYLKNADNLYYYDGHKLGYPSTEEIEYWDGHKTKTNTVFKPVYTGWAENKIGGTSPDSMDVCYMLAYIPSGQEYLFGRIHEQTVTNTTAGGKSVSQKPPFLRGNMTCPQPEGITSEERHVMTTNMIQKEIS